MPTWLVWLTAPLVAYAIWKVGTATLRSLAHQAPGVLDDAPAPREPEDVEDLDVVLVCSECGTELRVSKLGELQIPRHCGEKMQVERRTTGA
ncbi:MAG TPA: hypothetical protein VE032_11090 [Actinomycetota bacterium]|nr:hypothetical protein [Actinomycetota bacterium]